MKPEHIIRRLNEQAYLQIGKERMHRHEGVSSSRYVQYNMRHGVGGEIDDVYYEINTRGDALVAQLHVRAPYARASTKLREVLLAKANENNLHHTQCQSKDFVIYGGDPVDCTSATREEVVIQVLKVHMKELFRLFEGCLNPREGGSASKSMRHDGEKIGENPWYVDYDCDERYWNKRYDNRLGRIQGLTWLPWVGKRYGDPENNNSRILVVGESNYAAKNWMEYVNHDERFTRKVIDYSCMVRRERISTMSNIALLLKRDVDSDPVERSVWSRIAYCDVCQCCVENGNQPCRDDFSSGFPILLQVIEILDPSIVVFAGTRVVGCAGLDYERGNTMINRSHGYWGRIQDNRPFVAVKHPGRFFTVEEWRNFLQERGVV